MSGHSRWSNIKHRKEKSDSQKGKVFTKLGREIMIAVKQGGSDPESNSKLKDAIAKAKAENLPNDNIARSIKKAAGEGDLSSYEEITYEGYGPGGIAVIVETFTDNRNRTAGDVRHLFDKSGGNLGTSGCVSFMFEKKGVILIEKIEKVNEDELMMMVLDIGADDFNILPECFEILTSTESFSDIRIALENNDYSFISAQIEMLPSTTTNLTDQKQIESMEKLIDNLEDLDDVRNVYHNWEQDEE